MVRIEETKEVGDWMMKTRSIVSICMGGFMVVILFVTLGMWGCPQYEVWQKGKLGEAQLSQAMQNRKIQIQEAEAKMESSKLWAQAEVIRAEGVAKANKIIGESLHNNEAYLRYLWIIDVAGANVNKTIVYIPTETNLPILEAGRFTPGPQIEPAKK
jgi:hypothetical protein